MSHRIGSIGFSTSQGISHLMKWFYDANVITDVITFRHGSRPSHPEWYPPDTVELVGRPFNGPVVDEFLSKVDAVLFFETPFDWSFLSYCRTKGVRTVVLVMYECWPNNPGHQPDKFICPSKLDQRDYWPNSPFLQIPVPPGIVWRQRTEARRFLHNGGNLGLRGHKGTLEILKAWRHVESPASLTVRAQDSAGLEQLLGMAPEVRHDPRITITKGNLDYGPGMFAGHDVFIMAEKYNGLSLPLIEARASGMLVMTSNRFPMNDWLPTEPLIPVKRYQRARVSGAYQEYDEAVVAPEAIAETVDRIFGSDIADYSLSGKAWAQANSWDALRDQWIAEVLG